MKSTTRFALACVALAALLMGMTSLGSGRAKPTSVPESPVSGSVANRATSTLDHLKSITSGTAYRKSSVPITRGAVREAPDDASTRSTTRHRRTYSTIVRGGFVNEAACPFGALGQTSDPTTFTVDCRGPGSVWTGGFTGHTLVHLTGTIDVYGNFKGTYEEWFYGKYVKDDLQGGLHFKGTFSSDGETAEFFATSSIVDGTCGFAGSTGTLTADGNTLFGGYTATWIRPVKPAAPAATCNPVDPASLPV